MPTKSSRRLWRASPLTYIALIIAVLLSVYPFYYMFVIATRSNDAINDTPPPFTPGGNVLGQLRPGARQRPRSTSGRA